MRPTIRALAAVAVTFLFVACGSAVPSSSGSSGPLASALEPATPAEVSPAPPEVIAGPWRSDPIRLADSQIAVVSDACAATARAKLGEIEAQLPTAVVDARGDRRFVAVLSDGGVGVDCVGRLTDAGATVDAVDRLAVDAVAPVDQAQVAMTELAAVEDTTPWTVAFGRSGPDAAGVRIGFGDGSVVSTTEGEGWWAAWWPGSKAGANVESLDATGAVAATLAAPAGGVESRLATASWWLDPAASKAAADATTLKVLIRENACSSGHPGADRVDPPDMQFSETAITIRLDIRRLPGVQDCQASPPFPFTLDLPEAVGGRALLDASSKPPRDATKPPPGG